MIHWVANQAVFQGLQWILYPFKSRLNIAPLFLPHLHKLQTRPVLPVQSKVGCCWPGGWEMEPQLISRSSPPGLGDEREETMVVKIWSDDSETQLMLHILWLYQPIISLILLDFFLFVWLVVVLGLGWFFFHRITMNKLHFGGLNLTDFWCLWTSTWTFLSLSRFLELDLSGMAWRHS